MMEDRITQLFRELVKEFEENSLSITLQANRVHHFFRVGNYPSEGTHRYFTKGYNIIGQNCFDIYGMRQVIWGAIKDFSSVKKIFEAIVDLKLWPRKLESFEKDSQSHPSITHDVAAGFLVRNFEINQYRFLITSFSFSQSINELLVFFQKNTFDFTTYYSLYGPHGDVEEIRLSANLTIKRANYDLVKLFGLFYSSSNGYYIDLYESDYLIEMKFSIPKEDFMKISDFEDKMIKSSFLFPLLSGNGNIEGGKILRQSSDWPLLSIIAPNAFYYNINEYRINFQSDFFFNNKVSDLMKNFYEEISLVDLSSIDWHIKSSIERLKKAKSSKNLNDRIVELSLALEYLINTTGYEVTLQLCLKTVKIIDEKRQEEEIFKMMKKFYSLRSDVVHGNKEISNDTDNKLIVDFAEDAVLKIIRKLIKLNSKYNFKKINEVLNKSLYSSSSFLEMILNE